MEQGTYEGLVVFGRGTWYYVGSMFETSPTIGNNKTNARLAVLNAVGNGKIVRPTECTVADCTNTGRIEGHHFDYSRKLSVIWLCTGCHASIHNAMRDNIIRLKQNGQI